MDGRQSQGDGQEGGTPPAPLDGLGWLLDRLPKALDDSRMLNGWAACGMFYVEFVRPLVVQLEALGLGELAARLDREHAALAEAVKELNEGGYRQDGSGIQPGDGLPLEWGVFFRKAKVGHAVKALRELLPVVAQAIAPAAEAPDGGTRRSFKETNTEARIYLRKHRNATARELSDGIGCALGMVPKLPAWRAVNEERKKHRKPKPPKVVSLHGMPEDVTGRDDDGLKRLIDDQSEDGESDGSIRPYEQRGKSRFHQRRVL